MSVFIPTQDGEMLTVVTLFRPHVMQLLRELAYLEPIAEVAGVLMIAECVDDKVVVRLRGLRGGVGRFADEVERAHVITRRVRAVA